MTSVALNAVRPEPGEVRPHRRLSLFWVLQFAGWSAYAGALTVPWIGEYPLRVMIPNKLLIAGSGLLASIALRHLYRNAGRHVQRLELVYGIALGASALAGIIWSAFLALALGSPVSDQLTQFGTLPSGIPALAGAPYHGMILLLWSVAYIGLTARRARPAAGTKRPSIIPASSGAQLLLRDGKRTIVVPASDVDWIEADGDYVRVNTRTKSLLLRDTMARLESTLSSDFMRIHRSAIVNVGRVSEVVSLPNRELVVMLRNGVKLRASRTYSERLQAALGR